MKESGEVLLNLFYRWIGHICYWLNIHAKWRPHEISIASHLENITAGLYDKYFSFKNMQD